MLVFDRTIDTKKLDQSDPAWLQARLGHVTGSCMDDVMAKVKSGEAITRYKYKVKLACERLTGIGQEGYKNSSMDWGKAQEEFAAIAYQMEKDVFIDKVGFWKHPTIDWVGVSPDRIAGDGLVQFKCPDTHTHVQYLLSKTMPTEYVKQIQTELWVCEKEWSDFVSFDPRINKKNQLHIVRVYRDEELIKKIENETIIFLSELEDLVNKLGE